MSASTLEELQDALDDNIQWRRLELLAIKNQIASLDGRTAATPRGRGLLRSGVALLYAHWEGYTKEACQSYLDFVAIRRLKYGELSDSFVLASLQRIVGPAMQGDPSAEAKLLEIVRRGPTVRSQIPRESVVNTRSNLRHDILREIFRKLGLDVTKFDTKGQLIDRRLCDQRNDICHGRDNCPTIEAFIELHSEVVEMIETMRDLIVAAANGSEYRYTSLPVNRPGFPGDSFDWFSHAALARDWSA
jgi:hypothetical protein